MSCDSKFCTAKKYLKAEAGAAIATTCKADATKTPPVPEFGNIDTYPGCQQQTSFERGGAKTADNSNKATAGLAPVAEPAPDPPEERGGEFQNAGGNFEGSGSDFRRPKKVARKKLQPFSTKFHQSIDLVESSSKTTLFTPIEVWTPPTQPYIFF